MVKTPGRLQEAVTHVFRQRAGISFSPDPENDTGNDILKMYKHILSSFFIYISSESPARNALPGIRLNNVVYSNWESNGVTVAIPYDYNESLEGV